LRAYKKGPKSSSSSTGENTMGSLGIQELVVIFGIAVLLFGGKKLPELAKGLGDGIRNFRTAIKDEDLPKAL
jgi:sec-independent protein translocase protein TatA